MKFIRLYVRVLQLLGSEARLGWLLALANVLLAAAQFAEPVLFGRIIDAMAPTSAGPTTWPRLMPLLIGWVGFGLFTIVCGALIALHSDRLAHRRRHAVMTNYFEHLLQLPLSYHGGSHSGRLMKVMLTGTDSLWWLWLGFFREHLAAFVSLLVLLPLSLFINWQLASLLIILCVVFTGLITLVQSFSRVEAEVVGMRNVVAKLLGAQMPVLSWWALTAVLTRASTTLTMLAIFVVGISLYMQGLTTIGEIVTFTSFAGLLVTRLEQAVAFAHRLYLDVPRLKEFFEVLDTVPSVRDQPDAIDPGRVRGLVEFKDVSFSYDGKRAAVADLNFTVLPGEVIALVGSTGAGKSTALALLHRVFDPQSGSVKIDGMDIRAIKLAALRRNIGVVFQEVLLLNRSIAENLRVGKPDATDAEIREAADRAQALEFIDRNPDGLEAGVGERGRMLSGGERQRVSIARALLKNPPILILDEATSALDATTEAKVQAALDEVMKDRTTFVIAHRLSTVRNATRILVFENSRVVESGSFDELVKQNGVFAGLARAQFLAEATKPKQLTSDAAE